jgi:hypothetical protein
MEHTPENIFMGHEAYTGACPGIVSWAMRRTPENIFTGHEAYAVAHGNDQHSKYTKFHLFQHWKGSIDKKRKNTEMREGRKVIKDVKKTR